MGWWRRSSPAQRARRWGYPDGDVSRASLGVRDVAGAPGEAPKRIPTRLGEQAERALGFFHIVTGLWLLDLVYAVALNAAAGSNLPA